MAESGYLLGSSGEEQDRLFDHVQSFGQKRLLEVVRPGMSVLDVGCGPGAVSLLLANAVGPEGRVIGVDLQPEQLARAAAAAQAAGLENVSFQSADATNLPFDDGSFDLVYAKFLLIHLPDPRAGVVDMTRVLAQGGTFFVYDVDAGASIFWPRGTAAERGWDLGLKTMAEAGSDPHVGRKLYAYLTDAGLQRVHAIPEVTGACAGQPKSLEACKRQIVGMLTSLREHIVASGEMSAAKLDELMSEVMVDQPGQFFALGAILAWGSKA